MEAPALYTYHLWVRDQFFAGYEEYAGHGPQLRPGSGGSFMIFRVPAHAFERTLISCLRRTRVLHVQHWVSVVPDLLQRLTLLLFCRRPASTAVTSSQTFTTLSWSGQEMIPRATMSCSLMQPRS